MKYKALDAVLAKIPFEGCLAGGCVRDTVFGTEIKDYDFYMFGDDYVLRAIFERYPNHTVQAKPDLIAAGYPLDFIMTVIDTGEYIDGKELQIMVVHGEQFNSLEEFIEANFDFGICKAAYNEDGLWTSFDFDKDDRQGTITYTPSKYNYFSQNHADRLVAKFPEFKLVLHDPSV